MRVGILGLGLIGGSLLRRLAGEDGLEVRGWDAGGGVREAASETGFAVAASEAALAKESDVVLVALPPRATAPAVVRALAATPSVVVCDVASVKAPILEAVRAAVTAEALNRFVPAHPLAGAEATGWASSRADLLDDAVWAICPPTPDAPLDGLGLVAAVLDRLDARLLFCTAGEHDAAVARSSHVPHVVAQVLALTADTPLAAVLSGGALRDGTRVAGANPDLWRDVLAANADATAAGLSDLIDLLSKAHADLVSGRMTEIGALWSTAARARRRVGRARWLHGPWERRRLATPALGALLALGRDGRLIRRLVLTDAGWELELTSPLETDELIHA